MEKDIDVLRESIIEEKYHLYKDDLKKCVKNVIDDYKRQLEINQEHQKVNGELRQKIKELEDADLTTIYLNGVYDERSKWKQKIKDKMEEINMSGGSDGRDNIENLAYELMIEVLKELLERG